MGSVAGRIQNECLNYSMYCPRLRSVHLYGQKITSCFYHNRLMLNSFPVSYLFLEGGEDPGNEVDPR